MLKFGVDVVVLIERHLVVPLSGEAIYFSKLNKELNICINLLYFDKGNSNESYPVQQKRSAVVELEV